MNFTNRFLPLKAVLFSFEILFHCILNSTWFCSWLSTNSGGAHEINLKESLDTDFKATQDGFSLLYSQSDPNIVNDLNLNIFKLN